MRAHEFYTRTYCPRKHSKAFRDSLAQKKPISVLESIDSKQRLLELDPPNSRNRRVKLQIKKNLFYHLFQTYNIFRMSNICFYAFTK